MSEAVEGIGTDIIELDRIKNAIDRHGERFLERLFTEKEIDYCRRYRDSLPRFAGRFAGKEAIVKALGTGVRDEIAWKEIEIVNDGEGKPEVFLSKALQSRFGRCRIHLSISHCETFATATAILVKIST